VVIDLDWPVKTGHVIGDRAIFENLHFKIKEPEAPTPEPNILHFSYLTVQQSQPKLVGKWRVEG
jgi:hypothetical protein